MVQATQLLELHSLEWLDEQSLMSPRRPPEPFVPAPDETLPPSAEGIEAARQATLLRLSRAYSRERVRRFAHKILCDHDEQRIGDLSLTGPDDLPMLIYLRRYRHDGMLGYVVVELDNAPWIKQAGIVFAQKASQFKMASISQVTMLRGNRPFWMHYR